jgi:BirA family biotin operon repressor/biotin-[acetyl-CoA-carboxylase] ligase
VWFERYGRFVDSFVKITQILPRPRNVIGTHIIELQQVESTNNYATALVHAGLAQAGTVVWAHDQTKGKGQRHKSWEAAPGENITASFLLDPGGLPLSAAFSLSQAVAVGVHRFFSRHAGDQTNVKWPNDIFWQDRKAGGILIENIVGGGGWRWAVAGIGININQVRFEGLGREVVSLRQVTGRQWDLRLLLAKLSVCLAESLDLLADDPEAIRSAYQSILYKRGETVRLRKGSRVFEAEIRGVTDDGRLIAWHGAEELFSVGEVAWL